MVAAGGGNLIAAAGSCADIRPEANLDYLFRPLENQRSHEMLLSKEKAKAKRQSSHPSWLRIYAIKLDIGATHLMEEREHTLNELKRMEMVRNHLLNTGIIDANGMKEDLL